MITVQDIVDQAARASAAVAGARALAQAPENKKRSPTFGSSEIQTICGITAGRLKSLLTKLPGGEQEAGHARREWSLPELQIWAQTERKDRMRPQGCDAAVVTLANFKGGVTKTTTAVSLAQGLSKCGHKVLFIDMDPQGSATELLGLAPDQVDDDMTTLPIMEGTVKDILEVAQPTYWAGIDLVASNLSLYGAEFILSMKQKQDPGFTFWTQLDYALDAARQKYDVIVIDTAPALSFVSINAIDASDGLVIPLPPSMLDYASAAQFWQLFSDLCSHFYRSEANTKEFAFVDVLLSKVDANDSASAQIRQYIQETFTSRVLPIEIPKTTAATSAARDLGTIYDINSKASVSPKTYARAKVAYDRFVELIEDRLHLVWNNQIALMTKSAGSSTAHA